MPEWARPAGHCGGSFPPVGRLTQGGFCLHRLMPRGHRRKCSLRSARWWRPSDLYNLIRVPGGHTVEFSFLSSSLSFSLALTPRDPHALATNISPVELRWCACPPERPIRSQCKEKKKTKKKRFFFSTIEAPVGHILFSSSRRVSFSFSLWPRLPLKTAVLRHRSVQGTIIPPAVTESMSEAVFGEKKKVPDHRERWGRRKRIGQRELLMLSCTALCFVLYQACKNYSQASTAFCALKARVEHHLSKTELK